MKTMLIRLPQESFNDLKEKGALFVRACHLRHFRFCLPLRALACWPLCVLACVLVGCLNEAVYAEGPGRVNWASLDLSPHQQNEIGRLESEWQTLYQTLYPQIVRDRTELRRLLNDPNASEKRVLELEARIQSNEHRLRQEATRVFLHKKNNLNPVQRVKLQQIMPE